MDYEHDPNDCVPGECFECEQYRNYLEAGWPEINDLEALELAQAVGLLGPDAPLYPRPAP
jgi:hypothetical protein